MSLNRYAKKVDANQPEIVQALRSAGLAVWVLTKPADLLVGVRGRFVTLEIKDGGKPASKRQLTPDEAAYFGTCVERNLPHYVVTSVEEALEVCGGPNWGRVT